MYYTKIELFNIELYRIVYIIDIISGDINITLFSHYIGMSRKIKRDKII